MAWKKGNKYEMVIVRTIREVATVSITVTEGTKPDEMIALAHRVACAKEVWSRQGKPEVVEATVRLTHIHGEPIEKEL